MSVPSAKARQQVAPDSETTWRHEGHDRGGNRRGHRAWPWRRSVSAGLAAGRSPQARLTLAAQCLLAGAFWLLLSIGLLARHRFFTPEDIDGSGLTSGTEKAKVLQALLQNTLEQTTLAALTYIAFAALAPAGYLGALPAAALLFWCGRALFWNGYEKARPPGPSALP